MYGAIKSNLQNELKEIKEAGLYKKERIITSSQDAVIKVSTGEEVINFCANNYLGLSNNTEVVKAAKDTLDSHGFGMSSVRFICGTQDIHKKLENKIAELLEADRLVSKGDEGLKDVIKRASETGERAEEAIGLLNKFGKALTEAGEKTAIFSGNEKVEELGRAFQSANDASKFKALAIKIEEYTNLIEKTKIEAVDSKISGITEVTAREALSNNEAFIDAFINSGGEGSKVEFSILNDSKLFDLI